MRGDAAIRFGRNLFLARRRAGFSQEELAALCSLHRTEIGKVETGRRLPRVDTLVKLTAVLEIRADDLLRGIGWTLPAPSRPGSFDVEV
jgi:transcriptional regulator with XRE-family HTH domain